MSENYLKHLTCINTNDGSPTLEIQGTEETYHSRHGAVQESMHVFIKNGLGLIDTTKDTIKILEVGLGTGLNALLTHVYSLQNDVPSIKYHALETQPLEKAVNKQLDYATTIEKYFPLEKEKIQSLFHSIIDSEWERKNVLSSQMTIQKGKTSLQDAHLSSYNLVYYDAFGPKTQPEMWDLPSFEKITPHVEQGGILVTYCAQGAFRRNLYSLGWDVQKVPGPPGKREMVVAKKL